MNNITSQLRMHYGVHPLGIGSEAPAGTASVEVVATSNKLRWFSSSVADAGQALIAISDDALSHYTR